MRELRVLLLGRPRLEVDGQPLAADLPPKYQLLLYFLAAEGVSVGRAELASFLWEDRDATVSRGNLRTALTRLRRSLPGVLAIDSQQVGFDPAVALQVDWAALGRAATGEGTYGMRVAAAQTWRGPLLDGFDLGGDAVERWLTTARARAQRQAVSLRRALAGEALACGRPDEAEEHWRALLDIDDVDEAAHLALMELLAAAGRRTAAIAQYEACRSALMDRLGARPSTACYALYTQIHADRPALTPVSTLSSASPPVAEIALPTPDGPVARTTEPLPRQRSSVPLPAQALVRPLVPAFLPDADGPLIGRSAELTLLSEQLTDADYRWLTVVGPGGVGKTRLALAAAASLAPHWRHGVLWISGRDAAGPLCDAETLAQRVIERTGADRVQPRALLLVLDNLETLAEPAMLARSLRDRAPGLCVLATSRRRLGVPREWLLELTGLSVVRQQPDTPASSPAAALLTAAVRRLDPRFNPMTQADAVESLCERVGGLPLALELAARGVLDAGLPAVLARLQAGSPLEDRGRGDPSRQHNTDVVMGDAWVLLPAQAQAAALRLGWLPGAFDLPLAETVGACAADVVVLREHSWLRRTDEDLLALHPLQQAFLRRQVQAAVIRTEVRTALAAGLRAALPVLAPFAAWPSEIAVPIRGPMFSASVLFEALEHMLSRAPTEALAAWVDSVFAALVASDRLVEAASLLERALRTPELPAWRSTGWRLLQAQTLNSLGDVVASMQGYEAALADLGLDGAVREGSGWRHLPLAIVRALRRPGWPKSTADRHAFQGLLCRSFSHYTQQLSFTPVMDRAVRANLLASTALLRADRAERHATRMMTAYGMIATGKAPLARGLLGALKGRTPVSSDPLLEAFTREGDCVIRVALGRWDGVVDELQQLHQELERLGDHRHAMECHALIAKLLFYQGQLVRSADRFLESTELALRRPGGAWRAWGPFGQAEVALCMDGVPLPTIEHWVDLGSHWLTEKHNFDTAYVLRGAGLRARLAWRCGDTGLARETVLSAIAIGARIPHCSFWAHEGFAGIGDVLLQLRAHEQRVGGALGPLDDAWSALEPQLLRHTQRFPAGAAMVHRLRGQTAHARERESDARRWLLRAVREAEAQGLRVELARSCDALATVDPVAGWSDRAGRLWREMLTGLSINAPSSRALASG